MEPNEISLLVDAESISQFRSGRVLGLVRWRINQQYFPSELWDDFVLVILADWIQSFVCLSSRTSRSVVLHFMDGPFFIRCNAVGDSVFCNFIESGASGQEYIINKWKGDPKVIAKSLVAAADIVLFACKKFMNSEKDLLLLASRRNELQKYI